MFSIIFRKNVKLQEFYKYKSSINSSNVDTEEEFQLDPFQKQNEKIYNNGVSNNEIRKENKFTLKMKERRLKVEEVCSRYHKTINRR